MTWLFEHTVGTLVLACGVWGVVAVTRPRPSLAHLMWLLVLVKLVTPPLVAWPVLPAGWIAAGAPTSSGPVLGAPVLGAPGLSVPVLGGPASSVPVLGGPASSVSAVSSPLLGDPSSGSTVAFPAAPPDLSTTSTAAAATPLPWLTILAAAWALGALIVGTSMLRGVRRIRRLIRGGDSASPELNMMVRELAKHLGITEPRVAVVRRLATPFVWGVGRPTLVWPHDLDVGDPATRAVLAHEFAHLRRRDHWVARFEVLGSALLWWHPLFWFARSRMRYEAELACDAWALWAVPLGRQAFARALVDSLEKETQTVPAVAALGASSGSRRVFEKRLKMILHARVPRRLAPWTLLPVAAMALTIFAGPSFAQDPERRNARRNSLEQRIEKAVRQALAEHEATEGEAPKVEVRIEGLKPSPRNRQRSRRGETTGLVLPRLSEKLSEKEGESASLHGVIRAAMEEGLSEARLEIRSDPDLRELGITEDVEGLLGSLLGDKGEFGESLQGLIGKAMAHGLKDARSEIRSDPDLRELGITEDVEGLLGSLLGDKGDFGESLQGLIGKAMAHGLKDARSEIRSDPDLRELGITEDVEGLLGSMLGDEGDFGESLQGLIGKAMAHGLKDARLEIHSDPDLRELGITEDVEGLLDSLLGDEGGFGESLQGLIEKAMAHGLQDARGEIRGDPGLRELGVTKDVEGLVESILDNKGDFGVNLQRVIEKAVNSAARSAGNSRRGEGRKRKRRIL